MACHRPGGAGAGLSRRGCRRRRPGWLAGSEAAGHAPPLPLGLPHPVSSRTGCPAADPRPGNPGRAPGQDPAGPGGAPPQAASGLWARGCLRRRHAPQPPPARFGGARPERPRSRGAAGSRVPGGAPPGTDRPGRDGRDRLPAQQRCLARDRLPAQLGRLACDRVPAQLGRLARDPARAAAGAALRPPGGALARRFAGEADPPGERRQGTGVPAALRPAAARDGADPGAAVGPHRSAPRSGGGRVPRGAPGPVAQPVSHLRPFPYASAPAVRTRSCRGWAPPATVSWRVLARAQALLSRRRRRGGVVPARRWPAPWGGTPGGSERDPLGSVGRARCRRAR